MPARFSFPVAVLLLISALSAGAQERVEYLLQLPQPGAARVRVEINIPDLPAGPQALVIPRAIPGSAGLTLYDRYLENVEAFDAAGAALAVQREADGPRWALGATGASPARVARVRYEVDLGRMERELLSAADASKARARYVGLLGYSVFGYIEGTEFRRVRLRVEAPANWPVFTTLAPQAPAPFREIAAEAPGFYELADSQIMMGPALLLRRFEGRVPLYLAVYAEGEVDLAVEGGLAREALDRLLDYFGGAPFAHYTVHLELLRPVSPQHNYFFSMEHTSSGTFYLGAGRGATPRSSDADRARTRFNYAHHIAHSWVPKVVYGAGYKPFTWELTPVLDTWWFNEGFARYAAIDALADAMPAEEAAAYRAGEVARLRAIVESAPPFLRAMDMVDLSRVASFAYSDDFRVGRSVFARGAVMAAEMDEEIRRASNGAMRLRDALRHLVAWGQREQRAFRIDELPALVAEGAGVNVDSVFVRWMRKW